jgi:hypothetical protein
MEAPMNTKDDRSKTDKPAGGYVAGEEATGQMPVPETRDDVLRSQGRGTGDPARRTVNQPTGIRDGKRGQPK